MKDQIVKHLRKPEKDKCNKSKGKPYATLLGVKYNGSKVFVSYSKCDMRYDVMSKNDGIKEAHRKIFDSNNEQYEVPHDIKKEMPKFIERCKRYFKTDYVYLRC